jgi:hypothetical protein
MQLLFWKGGGSSMCRPALSSLVSVTMSARVDCAGMHDWVCCCSNKTCVCAQGKKCNTTHMKLCCRLIAGTNGCSRTCQGDTSAFKFSRQVTEPHMLPTKRTIETVCNNLWLEFSVLLMSVVPVAVPTSPTAHATVLRELCNRAFQLAVVAGVPAGVSMFIKNPATDAVLSTVARTVSCKG